MSVSWDEVSRRLGAIANNTSLPLDDRQRRTLRWMQPRIREHGVVLADEVGTGKTRIACAVMRAILECGGRVAVVVPPGLMHQWIEEARVVLPEGCAPKTLRTLRAFLDEASREGTTHERQPDARAAEWWLISHRFQSPRVQRNTSYWWRLALPTLARAELASRFGDPQAGALTRISKMLERKAAEGWRGTGWWAGWAALRELARRAVAHAPQSERRRLHALLSALPVLTMRENSDVDGVIESFLSDQSHAGHRAAEQILGQWLGPFDLTVIDEAHKSRGAHDDAEDDARAERNRTVLARLIDDILVPAPDARRLCLTATPMELSLSQWINLLSRARCGLSIELGTLATQRLHDASVRAAEAPDEVPRLGALCEASRSFQTEMAPFVTRHRRGTEPLIERFRAATSAEPSVPHPHRRVEALTVRWADVLATDDAWLQVLYAAEGMSQAARGLPNAVTSGWPDAVRKAYTRLAAGQVSADLDSDAPLVAPPSEDDADPSVVAKVERVAWWHARLRDARRGTALRGSALATPDFDVDTEHPRIVAAVREIERWTRSGEKVLVFGVFLGPMRRLRNVLNARHAVRCLDAGQPLPHAVATEPQMLAIATRQWERMRDEGALVGRLHRESPSSTKLASMLSRAHDEYRSLRERVLTRARHAVGLWRRDAELLGDADDETASGVIDHLAAFMVDDILVGGVDGATGQRPTLDELASEFATRRIRQALREVGEEDSERALARLRAQKLRLAFAEEHEFRQSPHARVLEGGTRLEAREHMQDAFNRAGSSPRVLIAQSQVGREGLNLHLACRVVLQFHAEWNPAVLEQQIGRVDRKGSAWEQLAERWLADGKRGAPPFIEVRQLVCEGTYDAHQWERVGARQRLFDATLFGALLPADAWARVPDAWVARLRAAAPSFEP